LILGGGIAGLSTSYHLGHQNTLILEKNSYSGGHARSWRESDAVWDEGPHVSFTENEYVRELFSKSVGGEFHETEVAVRNWVDGACVDHPVQSNLYQLKPDLRKKCLESIESAHHEKTTSKPENYREWLEDAFGRVFVNEFPARYTRKYWTVDPCEMSTDWIGSRVFKPSIEEVREGFSQAPKESTHYIKKIRYPKSGGFQRFFKVLEQGAPVSFNSAVEEIDLKNQTVRVANGGAFRWNRLVNTLPLPTFIQACHNLPERTLHDSKCLTCTELVLVNVVAPRNDQIKSHWMYVYDEQMLSTRITCTELLSAKNVAPDRRGIQVEVYFSKFRPRHLSLEAIASRVVSELVEMNFIAPGNVRHCTVSTFATPYANIVFTKDTALILERIWNELSNWGLKREPEDVNATTTWSWPVKPIAKGCLVMAGRFANWKYYWTDDCILRGLQIAIDSKAVA